MGCRGSAGSAAVRLEPRSFFGDSRFSGSRVARRVLGGSEAPMIDYPIGIEHFVRRIQRLIADHQNSREGRRMLLKLLVSERGSFGRELPDMTSAAE